MTYQHAETIAESMINGQHKQAHEQFAEALQDNCNILSLCEDMLASGVTEMSLIKFLARHLEE